MHERLKSYLIFLLILIIALVALAGFLFFTGIKDLQDDELYLILVVNQDHALAATDYQPRARIATKQDHRGIDDVRNLVRLWKELDHKYDRILLLELDGLAGISSSAFRFQSDGITKNMTIEEFIGLLTSEQDWHVRSSALGAWVVDYHTSVWRGDDSYIPLLDAYRRNTLVHYPTNGALFFLKILPLERWVRYKKGG